MLDNFSQIFLPDKCDWCPLKCGANRANNEVGKCGANSELIVARSSLHYWEEPPISGCFGGNKHGYGPGSGTIFFSNCSLKCLYCQNSKISGIKSSISGKSITLNDLVDMCLDLQEQGAMNINFVTGTHYRSYIISAVRKAKNLGLHIPIVWNCSGYENPETIYALKDTVDVWLPDFKYADDVLSRALSINKISNYSEIVLSAIESMLDICCDIKYDVYKENLRMTKGIIVRHMILPGQVQNSIDALSILFSRFKNNIKYSIMSQYTPVISQNSDIVKDYPDLARTVSKDEYEQVLDFADDLGIKDYFWQDGNASKESFIPDF